MSSKATRMTALRALLLDKRRALQADVASRLKAGREARDREVGDDLDSSDADVQHGMDFTLLQMKTETLTAIEHALRRVEAGTYGICADCEDDIAERRLRAIPFAKRCHECEGRLETIAQRERAMTTVRFEPDAKGSSAW